MNAARLLPSPAEALRIDPPVRHGSLVVPARAEADFEAAANYLARDPGMHDVIQRAEHLPADVYLTLNDRGNDSYDAFSRTLAWDPHSALRTTRGGGQSPALGLGHELDHASIDPRIAFEGGARYDPVYGNREERRVIEGSERAAARTLGESPRYDHGGSLYRVASPVLT
jgi:hypothetical protein